MQPIGPWVSCYSLKPPVTVIIHSTPNAKAVLRALISDGSGGRVSCVPQAVSSKPQHALADGDPAGLRL